ncbi:putative quinol monooxygenase [Rubritalea tangerina]|uniref:Quinol monooxygenase n=1 Tax=Rubritalea tangerina TaxID=430798 RepID=A0ABW4Z998_9BACT
MSKLTIIADIRAREDKTHLVKAELLKLIAPTRAEDGCINYDLHQDNDNPAHFIFHENWENRELWQVHMNSPHIANYLEATEGCVDEFIVHEMTHIE